MKRAEFLAALAHGLRDLPSNTQRDILDDYESFFVEAEQAGRTDADVVQALGNPSRLAIELRLAVYESQWHVEKDPRSAARLAILAVGLGLTDVLLLLPVGTLLLICATGVLVVGIAILTGLYLILSAPFDAFSPLESGLNGVGILSAAVAGGAAIALIFHALVKSFIRFGRMHQRLFLRFPPKVFPPRM